MVSTRPRLNTAQLRRKRINNNEDNAFMVKTGRQIMVSTVIALLVFAVSKIQNPVCTNITSTVKNILVYTVDYKKAAIEIYSQIKEVTDRFNRQEENIPQSDSSADTSENQSSSEENAHDIID
jgi:hypothetical protein